MTDREQIRRDERDYIARTIATVRNHRDADNCWPQWANVFADEIERLWVELEAEKTCGIDHALFEAVCAERDALEQERNEWRDAAESWQRNYYAAARP